MSARRTEIFERVYELARRVPRGKVTTYAALAFAIGRPRGARQIGLIMSVCPYPESDVPCHRVIRSDGYVGGYGLDGSARKARLLSKEGIEVSKDGKVDLSKFLYTDF
jgi:methylated-DNA-protein-cysteine methyltransferase-like protein